MKKPELSIVKIIDTTLREGEQSPGVYFTLSVKKQIIRGLADVGVEEIELGIATTENHDLPALVQYIRRNHRQQPFSLWCRCREEDIHYAASLAPDCLSLSIPASDLHLQKKLEKDRRWAVGKLGKSVRQALAAGVSRVAVGLEDASRAEPGFVRELAQAAEGAGAFRLRLADTVGICTPVTVTRLLDILNDTGLEVGVHCHNDFGMATANTITALEYGALWGDVTLLGLGERAGNSRLEEVLAYLVLQKNRTSYSLTGLPELSGLVAQESGREIAPSRPIIGKDLFSCETGIHLQGILKDPATYEPFDPGLVGARRIMLIGSQAGRHSIAATLGRLGLPRPDESHLACLTRRVRSLAGKMGRPLEDKEIQQLAAAS